jgi:exopolysaccharide production protein ExoF
MRKLMMAAAACAALWTAPGFAAPPVGQPSDQLESGDQVRIKVFEWRSSVGDVHEWTALNADYRVAADGSLSLPLLGAIKVAGITTEELADTISTRLQTSLGLAIRPQASVEIVEYPPFYILGDVSKPGEYPYTPGLTVLQAISIAGGKYRVNDPALLLTTAGELRVLRLQYSALLARRARLQAQLDDAPAINFPPELQRQQNDSGIAQLMQRETAMFNTQRDAVHSELDALNQLKSLLNAEVTSLQSKMKIVDQELGLMKQELNSTTTLVQQGLAIAPREYSQRETEIETEGRRLDLDTAALRAKEDIGKADQAIIELRSKTRSDIETQLTDIEQKIPETAARIGSSTLIVDQETGGTDNSASPQHTATKCLILHKNGIGVTQIAATEASTIEPGDTVEVLRANDGTPQTGANPAMAIDPPVHDATLQPAAR